MRLSDAIATGRVLLRPSKGTYFHKSGFGCAMGMAGVAVGINGENICAIALSEHWPWIMERYEHSQYITKITRMFDEQVCEGLMTLDQLIDWVRANEPKETEAAEEKTIAELEPSLVAQGLLVAQKS